MEAVRATVRRAFVKFEEPWAGASDELVDASRLRVGCCESRRDVVAAWRRVRDSMLRVKRGGGGEGVGEVVEVGGEKEWAP